MDSSSPTTEMASKEEQPKDKRGPIINWDVWAKTPGLESFGPGSEVEAMDGGVINFLYRVRSDKDEKLSVVLKQGEPYIKAYPTQLQSTERVRVEMWAMKKLDSIVPGTVPTLFLYDPGQNFIVMEDLGSYEIQRQQLNLGKFDISLAGVLASHIAKLHRATHKTTVDEASHREMVEICTLDDMQFIRTMTVFDYPLDQKGEGGMYAKEVLEFTQDQTLYSNWQKLRTIDRDNHDCLTHGDFHTSSVMIKGSSIKIFDFEMAHMGPAGADLGHMLSNFVKPFFDHKYYPLTEGAKYHEQLRKAMDDIVDRYFKEAREYLNEEEYARTISETAGFAGARLIRRVWGFHEPDEDLNQPLTDKGCLRVGYRLVRDFEKIRTIQDLKQHLLNADD